jgi:predicted Zn-dependent protease
MLDTEAFREFKQGLAFLRDDYADKALPHMRRAAELDKNNPYYMSYLGVVLARSEEKWGEAERLCDAAVRMKRNQAQLYLNLAEVYSTAGAAQNAGTLVPFAPKSGKPATWQNKASRAAGHRASINLRNSSTPTHEGKAFRHCRDAFSFSAKSFLRSGARGNYPRGGSNE